ncbi:M23 family metallopeptidase [Candidatus Ruminimicrobiellum ovillum]|uniref:M23 family metallopeptidase n=1 Tax=Candidatus Ruminimicrobiellum ovillum TaxID=1947927 RepID=UPI00355A825B
MKKLRDLLRELRRKVTIVFIHHGRIKPIKFNFSVLFLLVVFAGWTGMTLWAGFISGKHIDYLAVKADNKIMKVRMLFFADQIKKSTEMLAQVKQNDDHIRSLLAMDSKRIIIENGLGSGGPTPVESSALSMLLSGKIDGIDYQEISRQTFELLEEYKASMKSYSEVINHISKQREMFRYTPSIWPCKGIISSSYGIRFHPIFRTRFFHPAIDIANKKNTPILATADGVVAFSGWLRGYGNVITIEHGKKYRTVYAHLAKSLVKKGEFVTKGQEIAKMGNTGRSTGPHVHYELHLNKRPINPMKYLGSYLD